jgi:hypothetical protein
MSSRRSLNRPMERILKNFILQVHIRNEQGNSENIKMVTDHITGHIGFPRKVFHEIESEGVHIDIHQVGPSPRRNCNVLVTSGMSDRAMMTPMEARECRYAELMMFLPGTWPLSPAAFGKEENYWPLRWLKILARLPITNKTWLGWGHTIPNGDPPEPFDSNTGLCGMLIIGPPIEYQNFFSLKVNSRKTIYFFEVMPLYREEMEFKLRYGVDALLDRLEACNTGHILDINRVNVCRGIKR